MSSFKSLVSGAAVLLLPAAAWAVPVTVGTKGNEPLLVAATDGTLYISALQTVYRSANGGQSWAQLPGPTLASTVVASDSSISVDPAGRFYFSFDTPYAGTTAVCTSDDKGDTWACNPAVLPGATDRMWVTSPDRDNAYCVTNEGLYQTTFAVSKDRGGTWVPQGFSEANLEPQTGPLVQKPGSNKILQPVKTYNGNLDPVIPAQPHVSFYSFATGAATTLAPAVATPLPLPLALPSAVFGADNTLYAASEEGSVAEGYKLVVARSADEAATWTKLPAVTVPEVGTAIFSWIAAAEAGHIGAIFYGTEQKGDPALLTTAVWNVYWAETYDALSSNPHWGVRKIESGIHTGPICIGASCMGADRFAGDFINAVLDSRGRAHLTWMRSTPALQVRYDAVPVNLAPLPQLSATPASGAPGVSVDFSAAQSSDPDGDALVEYVFDFGDGSVVQSQSSAAASHVYSAAGQYTARLRVRDARGLISAAAAEQSISVTAAPAKPADFTYLLRQNVPLQSLITSEAKTLGGFSGLLTVQVSQGGQYSINGAAFTNAVSQIAAGSSLVVRHLSAATTDTATITTVTAGSYSTPFKSITTTLDRVPDAFNFGTLSGQAPGVPVQSADLVLAGYNAPAPIVAGPGLEYSLDGGVSFTTANGSLAVGQPVRVRVISNTAHLGYAKAYLKIGGVSGYFTVRTR